MNIIELSQHVLQFCNKEEQEKIMTKAKEVGLDKIDSSKQYYLIKTGEKNKSINGFPSKMEAIGGRHGKCLLLGYVSDNKVLVSIHLDAHDKWFKTSPVVKCETHDGKMFVIETENSFYELIVKN